MSQSNDNLTAEFFDSETEWKNVTSDDEMKSVSELAQKQLDASKRVDDLTEQLKIAKEELRNIQEIKLSDGSNIVVEDFYNAHIAKSRQEEAFEWLESNGFGDIIKHEVGVKFAKDQSLDAKAAFDQLRAMGLSPFSNKGVHPSTLKAFVKEQIQNGNGDIPVETFGLFIGSRAKIS